MAEETIMTNLDIKDFGTVQSLADADYVVLSLSNGTSAKITAQMLKLIFAPKIVDGEWYIGSTSLGVEAAGKTPELRSGSLGIEYKYTTEDDTAWRLIVSYTDIKLQFDSLTDSQKEEVYTGVSAQIKTEVIADVETAISNAQAATENANTAALEATEIAEAAGTEAKGIAEAAATNVTNLTNNALEEVNTAISDAEAATKAANKYANRVVDITEAEWEALEESGSWKEGVEYNVYEV